MAETSQLEPIGWSVGATKSFFFFIETGSCVAQDDLQHSIAEDNLKLLVLPGYGDACV